MKAVHSLGTVLVLASSLAVAWICLAPAAVQAATVYQWNGSADSDFTNGSNWQGGIAPTTDNAPGTLNYRLTVNNGSNNNPLVYTAAQGHTIYASDDRSLFIGTGASGSMTITGGTFESRAASQDGMANTSGTASLTIAGGEYRNTVSGAKTFLVMYGSGGTGNLNINSGLFSVTTLRYQGGTTTGNVYLNGGTLEAGSITDTGGNSNFFFNGGVLKPLASTTSFLQGLDNAQIQADGAKVDTSGFDVTIAQNLLDGGGGGGLTKQGEGTLTLSGTNTYTGNTLVYRGTLRLAGGDNRLPVGTILDLNPAVGSGAVIDLNGTEQEVAGLTNGNSSHYVTNLDGNNASTLTVNTSSARSFAGELQGNLSLVKKGASSLTLSGAGSYSGATNVAEGTLAISNDSNRLPTGTVLQMGSAADTGIALFDLNGQNQEVAGLASLGTTMTMEVTNSSTDPATLTVNNAAAYDYAGTLTGNLGLTKAGGSFLGLSAANSYTGATNVTAGTLKLKHDGALGNTSGVSITANATLLLDTGITAGAGKTVSVRGNGHNGTYGALRGSAGTSTWEGDVLLADSNARLGTDDSGTLIVTGKLSSAPSTSHGLVLRTSHNGGTVVLQNAGNDYKGSTLIYIGTLRLDGGDNTLPTGTLLDFNPVVSGSMSRLDLFGNDQEVSGLIAGSAVHGVTNSDAGQLATLTVNTSGTDRTFNGILEGNFGFVKRGGKMQRLTRANSYTGLTVVEAGRLAISNGGALGSTAAGTEVRGGVLALEGGITVAGEALTLGSSGTAATLLNVNGDNMWTGDITKAYVSTLQSDSGKLTIQGNVGGTVNSFYLAGNGDGEVAGNILTAHALFKRNGGTWTLSGTNSYSGFTKVEGGKLVLDGTHTGGGIYTVSSGATLAGDGATDADMSVADGGILSPGNSAGSLGTGSLTLSESSILDFELDAPNIFTSPPSDLINVTGDLLLNGILDVTALSEFGTPEIGDTWRLLNYTGNLTDNGLALGSMPALPSSLMFYSIDTAIAGQVNLLVVPEPGSLVLMVSALLGLLWIGQRRRATR